MSESASHSGKSVTRCSSRTWVLTTPDGKWFWWPALQCVDFIPRSRRRTSVSIYLADKDNTFMHATMAAARNTARMIRNEINDKRAPSDASDTRKEC